MIEGEKAYADVNSLSVEQKEHLKSVIKAMSDSMARADAEREYQKEAIVGVAEKFNLDKKIVRRAAAAYHKSTYNKEAESNSQFEEFYVVVLGEDE
jgi:hypothetical protein